MNYDRKNIKMQKKYSHHILLLVVPSIAIALIIIVGMIFVPTMNHSAAAQLSQQQQGQNANISLATISEAARNLAQKLGINSTEVSKPRQNMSDLSQKLAPGGSLANFQEQLKGLGQQLGLNGTLLSQLRQQLPAVNITEVGQKLEQISSNIP
jgi:hypothetical protein